MRAIALALAVLVALAAPLVAHADDQEDASKQEALALLKEGNAAARAGDHVLALEKFQTAYAKFASPKLLINIGTTFMKLGRFAEAADTYEKFLADPEAEADRKAEVQEQLALLEPRIARLRVELSIAGAQLIVDGRRVGVGGAREIVRVDPGSHTLVAKKDGFQDANATVSVRAGQVEVVEMRLEPIEMSGDGGSVGDGGGSVGDSGGTTAGGGLPDDGVAGQESGAGDTTATIGAAAPAARGGIGGMVRVALDVGGPDAAVVAGGTYDIGSRLSVQLAGILGGSQGVYVGGVLFLTRGSLRPALTLGVPIFFIDGARPAVRAAGGVAWGMTSKIDLTLDLGVEYFFSMPDGYETTLFVPSLGIQARL